MNQGRKSDNFLKNFQTYDIKRRMRLRCTLIRVVYSIFQITCVNMFLFTLNKNSSTESKLSVVSI